MTLTAEQLDLIASPACADVFTTVIGLGRATAKEVAIKTNRTPATALYHLRRLEEVGLVNIVDRRPAVKKPEAVYQASSREYELPRDAESKSARTRAVVAGFRQLIRGWERASEAEEPYRHILRASVRLSPQDVAEVVRRLEEINDYIKDRQREDGVLLSWTSAIYPVV